MVPEEKTDRGWSCVERQHLTLDRQEGNKIWRSWPGVKPRIADSHQAGLYIQAQWELTGLAMGLPGGDG